MDSSAYMVNKLSLDVCASRFDISPSCAAICLPPALHMVSQLGGNNRVCARAWWSMISLGGFFSHGKVAGAAFVGRSHVSFLN